MNTRGEKANQLFAVLFFAAVAVLVITVFFAMRSLDSKWRRSAVAKDLKRLNKEFVHTTRDEEILSEIINHLESDYEFGQVYACTTIAKIGPPARRAIDALIIALQTGSPVVQREAARAIGSLGADGGPAVDALIGKLNLQSKDVAWFSAEALGEIGIPAICAIPALKVAMSSSNGNLRDSAAKALRKLTLFEKYNQQFTAQDKTKRSGAKSETDTVKTESKSPE